MALYGILGGIHGNLEALRSVLAAFDARGVKKILCVGDVVGYNADPDQCVALLRARKAIVVAGQSDRIGTGLAGFDGCSNRTRYALARTRKELSADTAAWLRALPASRLVDDSIALASAAEFPTARVCFFSGGLQASPAGPLEKDRLQTINVGSVDAQAKRDHRLAECAIFDSDAWTVEFLQLRYDAASTEAKAAVGGYRILPATDAFYTWQRRAERLSQVASELTRAIGGFTEELLARRRLQPR